MSRAKPIIVGSRRFESKKAATNFIQAILHAYGPGQRVSPEHDAFLRDLIELHPERDDKVGCGIDHFTVERNPGSNGFWLTRTDGKPTDWSFYDCLTPPTPEMEAKAGFRSAVRSQISVFRESQGVAQIGRRCSISGEVLTRENLHVDHVKPFDELMRDFLCGEGLVLRDVRVHPTTDGSTETVLADNGLLARWQQYHQRNAKLRAVSKRANLSMLRKSASAQLAG